MIIARQLKEKNIAEYLLYMWQIEDLLRANQLDIEKMKLSVISKFGMDDNAMGYVVQWYEELIGMMREEGVAEAGHLQINENVLSQLIELHEKLLHSPQFPFYHSAFFCALPYIAELKSKSGKKDVSDLRTCFEMLYGVILLKLQKKEISDTTSKAITDISKLIAVLANCYEKNKRDELKF